MTANRLPTADEVANKPSPPPAPPGAGLFLPKRTVDDIAAEQAELHKARYNATHVTPKNPLSLEVRNKEERRKVAALLNMLGDLLDRSCGIQLPDNDLREMQVAEVDALGRRLLGESWERMVKT